MDKRRCPGNRSNFNLIHDNPPSDKTRATTLIVLHPSFLHPLPRVSNRSLNDFDIISHLVINKLPCVTHSLPFPMSFNRHLVNGGARNRGVDRFVPSKYWKSWIQYCEKWTVVAYLHLLCWSIERNLEFLPWKKKRKKKREVNKRYKLNCNLNINM